MTRKRACRRPTSARSAGEAIERSASRRTRSACRFRTSLRAALVSHDATTVEHFDQPDQHCRARASVLPDHMEHRVGQSAVVDRRHDENRFAVPENHPSREAHAGDTHRAAPSRSRTPIAVCGSLMPGDRARTPTSTNCRTAYSRSSEMRAATPVRSRRRSPRPRRPLRGSATNRGARKNEIPRPDKASESPSDALSPRTQVPRRRDAANNRDGRRQQGRHRSRTLPAETAVLHHRSRTAAAQRRARRSPRSITRLNIYSSRHVVDEEHKHGRARSWQGKSRNSTRGLG